MQIPNKYGQVQGGLCLPQKIISTTPYALTVVRAAKVGLCCCPGFWTPCIALAHWEMDKAARSLACLGAVMEPIGWSCCTCRDPPTASHSVWKPGEWCSSPCAILLATTEPIVSYESLHSCKGLLYGRSLWTQCCSCMQVFLQHPHYIIVNMFFFHLIQISRHCNKGRGESCRNGESRLNREIKYGVAFLWEWRRKASCLYEQHHVCNKQSCESTQVSLDPWGLPSGNICSLIPVHFNVWAKHMLNILQLKYMGLLLASAHCFVPDDMQMNGGEMHLLSSAFCIFFCI